MKTRDITEIAIMSASLTAGKLALSMVANVEIVTLFIIVFALSLGVKKSLIATITFVISEIFIYGLQIWVLIYFIHWPAVALLTGLIRNTRLKYIYASVIGIALTALFGVTSTLIEILAFGGVSSADFGMYFSARYIAGTPFFLTHIISNSILLPLGIYPISKVIDKIRPKPRLTK